MFCFQNCMSMQTVHLMLAYPVHSMYTKMNLLPYFQAGCPISVAYLVFSALYLDDMMFLPLETVTKSVVQCTTYVV